MNYELLIKQVEAFVSKYMQKHDNPKLLYHNLLFTQNIVSVANQIAKQYSLEEKDLFIVRAAAWFLNAGYYKDLVQPVEASIKMAEEFLKRPGVEMDTIEAIKKCMLATTASATPVIVAEKIVCDASSYYVGTENFAGYNKLHFKEAALLSAENINKNEWRRNTIIMLEAHRFYTDYCISRLSNKKQENLETLKKKNPLLSVTPNSIESMFEQVAAISIADDDDKDKEKEKLKEKMKNKESAERTIETMFKTTSVNSQRLSAQADTKAHIMISVNSIIISVLLSVVVRKIEEYENLIFPVILILLVSLVTIVFSILATRPNISKRSFTDTDLQENKVNMLFFGNFFTMDFERYSTTMLRMMSEKNDLYITLLRNLYEQGIVLARKYKMLKVSYNVFMYGLILSVISFFIASISSQP